MKKAKQHSAVMKRSKRAALNYCFLQCSKGWLNANAKQKTKSELSQVAAEQLSEKHIGGGGVGVAGRLGSGLPIFWCQGQQLWNPVFNMNISNILMAYACSAVIAGMLWQIHFIRYKKGWHTQLGQIEITFLQTKMVPVDSIKLHEIVA